MEFFSVFLDDVEKKKFYRKNFDLILTTHSGPRGENRQNPTFASLMQKLKLSYLLIKVLKVFGIRIKNIDFMILEKVESM